MAANKVLEMATKTCLVSNEDLIFIKIELIKSLRWLAKTNSMLNNLQFLDF
jgi:hypothetical protein